ncbi:MAG: carboxyl transferase domain-containing protein [Clostridia bacterium]|nr:carboxyl transferase domain-containing protein [Clostridia bacterium]
MSNTQDLKKMLEKKMSILQGDAERIAKQRAQGKLTARERVAKLLDEGSFVETDALVSKKDDYAGVVTGYGTVQDRPVYIFAQDFTVHGGAMGVQHAQKICKILDLAQKTGAPVIALCDSAGVRLDEGAEAMNAYAQVYGKLAKLSGVCPIIAVVLGPAIGGAALIAQLADVSIMAEKVGSMMVYGPQVMSAVSGKTFNDETAGGAKVMAEQGGVALTAADEDAAIALAVQVLDLLPGSNAEDAPVVDADDLNRVLPEIDAADAAGLMAAMADEGAYVELYSQWGKEIRVALTRIGGYSVGLVVSDASVNEGMLAPAAAAKAARFIRFCDCYSLPVVSLINSKGVAVPDVKAQSWTMITTAQLLYAYAEATCTKVSVVVGNAIGQSYIAMAAKGSADMTYAWPGAVISALTPAAAAQVLCADELKAGKARADVEADYAANVADGINAAKAGLIDDVVDPAETRKYVIAAIEMLASKRESNPPKKHGNLPL